MKLTAFLILAGITTLAAQQNPPPPPPPDGHRPPPPVIAVLDSNHDGVISADEIANSATALKQLDRNQDGQLTPDEMRPPPPSNGPDGQQGGAPKPNRSPEE
jgi:hypothetical protein